MNFRHTRQGARLHGSHLMSLRHPSKTSEAARRYIPGDPSKLIDWKAYARTDHLLIREVRDEVSAKIEIFIEDSPTMHWPTPEICTSLESQIPTKIEIASRIGYHLANIHLQMGDMTTMWLCRNSGSPTDFFRPQSSTDLVTAFDYVEANRFSGTEISSIFEPGVHQHRRTDVVYWIGDCLTNPTTMDNYLALGRRSCVLHVLSNLEVNSDWLRERDCYFDESWSKKEYLGRALLHEGNYESQIKNWMESIRAKSKKLGGSYFAANEAVSIANYLAFLESFVDDFAEG